MVRSDDLLDFLRSVPQLRVTGGVADVIGSQQIEVSRVAKSLARLCSCGARPAAEEHVAGLLV
jgi:hypothetical protein